MSLLYFLFLDQTTLGPTAKQVGCLAMFVGIFAQSGGFFLHVFVGQPKESSNAWQVAFHQQKPK